MDELSTPPRAAALLPIALLLHVAEEWVGGFPAWSRTALGAEVTPERFVFINTIGVLFFVGGTVAAFAVPGMAWFVVSFAALVGLNAVVHGLATVALGVYSPGTITGVLLYLPLSAVVLRSSAKRLPRTVFAASVAFGVLVHALATLTALR